MRYALGLRGGVRSVVVVADALEELGKFPRLSVGESGFDLDGLHLRSPRRMSPMASVRDCNARDRRRPRRRARALLFLGRTLTEPEPMGWCERVEETAVRRCGVSRTFQRAGPTIERPGSVNIGVNSQRTANTRRTLRRALEHSADYAGRGPDSAVCGAAHNFSALCLGARPKPPSRGMGVGLISDPAPDVQHQELARAPPRPPPPLKRRAVRPPPHQAVGRMTARPHA